MSNRITLNIPHSSVDGLEETAWSSKEELVQCVNLLTDWYTNIIFSPERGRFEPCAVQPFVFHKNRFVVDAERLINDPMESIGQGIVYTDFYGRIHRTVSDTEKNTLYALRAAYLAQIEQHILSNDRAGYSNVLIDCHSFPSSRGNEDICIGYNEDGSKPTEEVLTMLLATFSDAGYTIGVNTPYSNSLQPIDDLSLLQQPYCSFMIELNKKIYLNESDKTLLPTAASIRELLCSIYGHLLSL